MKRALSYYYYRLVKYYSNGSDIPIFRAFMVIIVFAFFNVMTLIDLIFAVGFGSKLTYPVFKGFNSLILIGILLMLYFSFSRFLNTTGFHERTIATFEVETNKEKRNSGLIVILYFILTIASFVLELFIRQKLRGF